MAKAKTMTVQKAWETYGKMEPDIHDADQLAKVVYELFMDKIAEVEISLTDEEHDYMMETLLNRLRDLTGEIKGAFYKAGKTVSAGREK